MLENPKNNLKSPHFPLSQATPTTICGEAEDAHHTASQAIHVERGQEHHRKHSATESSTCTEPSRRQHKVQWCSSPFPLAVLTNSLAPRHVEGMANNQSWGSTAALVYWCHSLSDKRKKKKKKEVKFYHWHNFETGFPFCDLHPLFCNNPGW